jgi:predicted ATPase
MNRPTEAPARRFRRYVLTGAPGSGKTALLTELARRGHVVVPEAATDAIALAQSAGEEQPWADPAFAERIVRLQRRRQEEAGAAGAAVQLYDRSPVCTLALVHYLAHPVPAALATEVDRVVRDGVYERRVFLVRPIGFVQRTAARRITYQESLEFEQVHRRAYLTHGYELVEIPAGPVTDRATEVDSLVRAWAFETAVGDGRPSLR